MSDAHRTRLTPELWRKLVAAYRVTPGVHTEAARAAGIDARTAKKAWTVGLSYEWGSTPISNLIGREQVEAREILAADAERQSTKVLPAAAPAAPAAPARAAAAAPVSAVGGRAAALARQAAETRADEARLVRTVRSQALVLSGTVAKLLLGSSGLAERMVTALEERFFRRDGSGNLVQLSIDEIRAGMDLIAKVAVLARHGAVVSDLCIDMEDKILGDEPKDAGPEMTRDQAVEELRESVKAFERQAAKAGALAQATTTLQ